MNSEALSEFGSGSLVIVDDSVEILDFMEKHLVYEGFDVSVFTDGKSALQHLAHCSPDIILLDVNMPVMGGYEVCRRIKATDHLVDTPVLFVSGNTDKFDIVEAFSMGCVDYISKPIEFDEVMARINTHVKLFRFQREQRQRNRDLQELVDDKVQQITNAQLGTILALAKLAESRDTDTGMHLDRVKVYCRVIADEAMMRQPGILSQQDVNYLEYGSALHDIGKVAIPDHILLKPGRHTPEEFDVMKQHTVFGSRTLGKVLTQDPGNLFIGMGMEIAESHHEKWDGSGYPRGLKGTEIPLSARIMAVADVYDALRAKRCYKEAFSHKKASAIIAEEAGAHFDPVLVEIFSNHADRFDKIWNTLGDE